MRRFVRGALLVALIALCAELRVPMPAWIPTDSISSGVALIALGSVLFVLRWRRLGAFVGQYHLAVGAAAAFLGLGLVSALRADAVGYSLKWLVIHATSLTGAFLLVFIFTLDRGLLRFYLRAVVAVAVALAALALVEAWNEGLFAWLADVFRAGDRQRLAGLPRPAATMQHANLLGSWLAAAVLVALWLRLRGELRSALFVPAVAVLLGAIARISSRTSLMMLCVPLAVLLFRRGSRRLVAALLGAALLLAVVLSPSSARLLGDPGPDSVVASPASTASPEGPRPIGSVESRFFLWRAALAMATDHPLLGVGPGGYNRALRDYAAPELRAYEYEKIEREVLNAHNGLLNLLAEWGLGGGLLALLAVFAVGRGLRRRGRLWPPSPELAVGLGLLLSFGTDSFFYSRVFMTLTLASFVLFATPGAPAIGPQGPQRETEQGAEERLGGDGRGDRAEGAEAR